MRAMWKGAISFGMVTIPVKLNLATSANEITLHQVHEADGGRIRHKRMCSSCSAEVPYAEIAKGYEVPGKEGEMVVLTDEDMDDLPLASAKVIMVEKFVDFTDVPLVYYSGRCYYVEPEVVGKTAYALLRHTLATTESAGVVRITLRNRERLGLLRAEEDVILLDVLNWPDEIRDPGELSILAETVSLKPSDVKLAAELVRTLHGKFDPSEYSDSYSGALSELVQAKLSSKKPQAKSRRRAQREHLADQLRASLAAVQKCEGTWPGPTW